MALDYGRELGFECAKEVHQYYGKRGVDDFSTIAYGAFREAYKQADRLIPTLDTIQCKKGYEDRKIISFSLEGQKKFAYEGLERGVNSYFEKLLGMDISPQIELHNSLLTIIDMPKSIDLWTIGADLFARYTVGIDFEN